MTETRQITTLVILAFLVGVIGVAIVDRLPTLMEGDVVVDDYLATLYQNGTLVEDYTYDVKVSNQRRMLFRTWEAPLSFDQFDSPYVRFIRASGPGNTIPYAKDYRGQIWMEDRFKNDPSVFGIVRSLADPNEVGIFKPDRFQAGKYRVRYVFEIYPPLECDNDLCHLNLKLANRHLTYRNVRLIIDDAGHVVVAYSHPPSLKEARTGNEIVFSGSIAKDELLELEILFEEDVLNVLKGFPRRVENVKDQTTLANGIYRLQYMVAQELREGSRAIALLNPLVLILVYWAWGREKRFVVPKYLSTIPNSERKPWIVNLVFKGDAFDFDENGFYATLLDLQKKGKIQMTTKNGGLAIRVLDRTDGDVYEQRALQFLAGISRDAVVDEDSIRQLVETLTSKGGDVFRLLDLKQELNYLTRVADPSVASEFMMSGRKRLVPIALVSVLLLAVSTLTMFVLPVLVPILSLAVGTSVVALVQSVIAAAFPATLFGRWLGSTYKEKLEWESFRRFLSDLAMIRKYAPPDLSMWGEWLVYGTALGVGDNVVKAMKELKIQLPEVSLAPRVPMLFVPVMVAALPSRGGGGFGGGGGGGGGFGAGGGFGGGGAGTR